MHTKTFKQSSRLAASANNFLDRINTGIDRWNAICQRAEKTLGRLLLLLIRVGALVSLACILFWFVLMPLLYHWFH